MLARARNRATKLPVRSIRTANEGPRPSRCCLGWCRSAGCCKGPYLGSAQNAGRSKGLRAQTTSTAHVVGPLTHDGDRATCSISTHSTVSFKADPMRSGMVPVRLLLKRSLLRMRPECRPFENPLSKQHQSRTSSPHTQVRVMETGRTDQEQHHS